MALSAGMAVSKLADATGSAVTTSQALKATMRESAQLSREGRLPPWYGDRQLIFQFLRVSCGSRFSIPHGMLLNVLSRKSDGCAAMQRLIRDSHDPDRAKPGHFKRAWQLFRALLGRGIVARSTRLPTGTRGWGREVLSQTVPDSVKTDIVREMELCLRDMLRGIDSSLLDEWEKMRDGNYRPSAGGEEVRPPKPEEPPDVTRDAKAFTAAIRTRVFAFLRAWSIGNDEAALAAIDSPSDSDGEAWTTARLRAAREAYRVEHASLRLDPEARNLRHTYVKPSDDGTTWRVQQMLIDPESHNDWVMEVDVHLAASREASAAVIKLVRVGGLA